jgi:hypothetical protein
VRFESNLSQILAISLNAYIGREISELRAFSCRKSPVNHLSAWYGFWIEAQRCCCR